MRQELPFRRKNSLTFGFEHRSIKYSATINHFSDGRLAEIFIDCCFRPGSGIAEHANDAAVPAGLLLQNHVSAETIEHSINFIRLYF
jgi:hypothetical protein